MLTSLFGGKLTPIDILIRLITSACVILFTLPVHEFAHAFVADRLGDKTARYRGRLTLNPFAHIDYFGALAILLFGFGWANPVPVNAANFKKPRLYMCLTALAGPVSNLIVAFVSIMFGKLSYRFYISKPVFILEFLCLLFMFLARINIQLAVFNLIPLPPLDGSRVLNVFLPSKAYFGLMRYERYIMFGIIVLLFSGILDYPINYASNFIYNLFNDLITFY